MTTTHTEWAYLPGRRTVVWNPTAGNDDEMREPPGWPDDGERKLCFVSPNHDLFCRDNPYPLIEKAFAVMYLCRKHLFVVSTWDAERLQTFASYEHTPPRVTAEVFALLKGQDHKAIVPELFDEQGYSTIPVSWPLRNAWLGVQIANQRDADEKLPLLIETPKTFAPAPFRVAMLDPLLGPVDLIGLGHLDWVICGAPEGGPAHPLFLDWARRVRNQCTEDHVPFFFKTAGPDVEIPADLLVRQCPKVDIEG